jgi:hypothetical protein
MRKLEIFVIVMLLLVVVSGILVFSTRFYSTDKLTGNMDIFNEHGTMLTSSPKDEYFLFSWGDDVFYTVGGEIRKLDAVTANDTLVWRK